ncbi:MAG: WbqC family protein [Candidatus Neomarinimicrobiota bacterium]
MVLGIMQPYFLPYIGYWQLLNVADQFVFYDNIQYVKRGWVNRNNILVNNQKFLFTIPIKKIHQNNKINEIKLIQDSRWKSKLLKTIHYAYKRAPYFSQTNSLLKKIIECDDKNLFLFIYNSIIQISEYLKIDSSKFIISSSISIDKSLKAEEKIISICKKLNTTNYYNPIGGIKLYDKENFKRNNIQLEFLKTNYIEYDQLINGFMPQLSIVDIMMFNSVEEINKMLNSYRLI